MLHFAMYGGGIGTKLATQAVILPMALRQKAGPASNTSRVQPLQLPHNSDLLRTITAPAELLFGPSGRTQSIHSTQKKYAALKKYAGVLFLRAPRVLFFKGVLFKGVLFKGRTFQGRTFKGRTFLKGRIFQKMMFYAPFVFLKPLAFLS